MPESFFILSKEFPSLSLDEVCAIAKTYDRFSKLVSIESNIAVIQTKTGWEKIAKRAAFVKAAGKVARKFSDLYIDIENSSLLSNAKGISCRVINHLEKKTNKEEIESKMGKLISDLFQVRVSLQNPDTMIYLILTKKQNFFALSHNYEKPSCHKKVVKHPHELNWKLTRAMINLAGIKEGETLCDPFCGTGTTLIEAESMGIVSLGIDFDQSICNASKANLRINGFEPRVINADCSYINKLRNSYEGIVADIPYGKNSRVSEEPEKIIHRFTSMIPRSKKLAIMCKKGTHSSLDWKPSKSYDIYRHKSLVRTILVK